MRVVIDSDILVAAYTGKLRKSWQVEKGPHSFLISPEIFAEVEKALRQSQFGLQPGAIRNVLKDILKRCELIRPQETDTGNRADTQDRLVLSLARIAQPDAILTGNLALQKQKTVEGIPILSFSQFLKVRSA